MVFARCLLLLEEIVYSFLYFGSRLIKEEDAVVLAYHSVGFDGSFYTVTPTEFHRQMEHLRRNYEILPVKDIVEFAAGRKRLPRNAVAITLDDGFSDIFSYVYPYLKRHCLPATIFVATEYVGREFPLDGLSLKMLSWDQIVEMSRNNVAIGAHTATHSDLSRDSCEEARENIMMSKEQIERRTGKQVEYFAYPYSRYNSEIIRLVRLLGFKAAFGGDGLIRRGDFILALNRIEVDRSISWLMFRARMTKAALWYGRVFRLLRVLRRFRFVSTFYDRREAMMRTYGGT
jgi:peptidoglycan/xylan/chitin deacetylase (PgdA/CDA1 family)